jgi:Ca2+-transporting ATPase
MVALMTPQAPTDTEDGLSTPQARAALLRWGPNELPQAERAWWRPRWLRTLREPLFILLLVGALAYLALGDTAQGAALLGFACLSVGLVVWQARRSDKALQALKQLATPNAWVWRDGQLVRLPACEVVPGDVLELSEGQRIHADAWVLSATTLTADESLLTGESVPVSKRPAPSTPPEGSGGPAERPRPGCSHAVWAGTLVCSGHGQARVHATGAHTEMGRLGASLKSIEPLETPLRLQTQALARLFGVLALAASALLVAWHLAQGHGWGYSVLAALAPAMALLPEEFPMVLTVFFALGAWRLAQFQLLTRHGSAIDALGSLSWVGVDKTGTLTHNRMSLARLATPFGEYECPAQPSALGPAQPPAAPLSPQDDWLQSLLQLAALASRRTGHDPMDHAVHHAAGLAEKPNHAPGHCPPNPKPEMDLSAPSLPRAKGPQPPGFAPSHGLSQLLHPLHCLAAQSPLPHSPLMALQWQAQGGETLLAFKGAPEAVMERCELGEAQRRALEAQVSVWGLAGLRVLGVAWSFRGQTHWGGLLGFEDPVRASVLPAIARLHAAGITVAMLTGDHPATARAVARQVGIAHQQVALGPDLAAAGAGALGHGECRVFARISPEQKLALVQAWLARGEVVAMTGDGVNDAPALKAAHLGVAMGARGSDVAREAATLVLLDDDWSHLADAVQQGRRTYENLRLATRFVVAVHVPLAALALLPVLGGWPPLLAPAHVVLSELIIDPACSLAFEGAPARMGLMQSPPRPPRQPLLGWPQWGAALLQGGALALAVGGVYAWALWAGLGNQQARTAGLLALSMGNLSLVASLLAQVRGAHVLLSHQALPFWGIVIVALLALMAALQFEPLRLALQLAPLGVGPLLLCAVAAVAPVGLTHVWLACKPLQPLQPREVGETTKPSEQRRGGP